MKIKAPILTALIMSIFWGAFLSCSDSNKFEFKTGNIRNVFEAAKKSKKNVFVLITDSTCGKCKHFETFLKAQTSTISFLNKEYILYKADISNTDGRTVAEITKCPSYPFPYFFDYEGNLLAFGFPNNENFNVRNLDDVKIDQFKFSELYRLPITIENYKELVSLNMKATLLMSRDQSSKIKAFRLFQKSLDIAAYPYNLSKTSNNLQKLNMQNLNYRKKIDSYEVTASDKKLYKNSEYEEFVSSEVNPIEMATVYSIDKRTQDLGNIELSKPRKFNFTITNTSKTNITIKNVTHICDCIKFTWSKTKIRPKEYAEVNGVFTPFIDGAFSKEIFIHTDSYQPMTTVFITGTVK
ncbi:DUF1573 domain-containing protein [Pedobacter hiemivivus]|uniref:DUF1573 domain-containing protein n=1 Tax=Pedobacter hiemivivus TaxID=2530454 RepID=A0A4R0N838_9SPHI|nr:DUF1573 domain-containing protein [Pedobacter hiemivivus]TCC96281.1 DUF1573 domain-containing protein [Pedobacter hiemivivus]